MCESGRGWVNAGSSVPSTFAADGMVLPLYAGGAFLKVTVSDFCSSICPSPLGFPRCVSLVSGRKVLFHRARGGWGPDWEGALWSRHRGWTSLGPPVTQVLFTAGHFSLFRLRFRCGYQSLNELCRCLAGRDTAPDIQFNRVCGHKMRRLRWRPL